MPESHILTSIQIACIGIIVVVGLFLIWRSLNKLHEKVERISCDCANMCAKASMNADTKVASHGGACSRFMETDEDEELTEEDQQLMNAIFEGTDPINSQATFMLFNPFGSSTQSAHAQVEIEEVAQDAAQAPPVPAPAETPSHVGQQRTLVPRQSDDGTMETTSGPSKTKLKKLSVEALKEALNAKGLSTDGTKNQLIDRLLAASD